MGIDDAFGLKFLGALFAIMNPLSGLPVFLTMTASLAAASQRRVVLHVVLYLTIVGAVTAVVGTQILRFFGIGIHDLQVAGGLVVLKIAFNMLGNADVAHNGEPALDGDADTIAFYPLTFPVLMGPGAMTTLILFAGRVRFGAADWVAYAAAFSAVVLSVGVVFMLGCRFGTFLPNAARLILARVMGLILAAIAVQMVADGLKALLPGLA